MLFNVENLAFSYHEHVVLKDVSFSLKDGESIALLGRNGSGKTTLLKLLLGFLKPNGGKIEIDGRNLDSISYKERAQLIAYIPQYSEMAFPTTVLDSVVMGRAPQISTFSRPKKEDYDKAIESIELMGIKHLMNKSMAKISGGEKQLAIIARALTQESRVLLLDEPTSALDYSNQLLVLESAEKLRQNGYTILFSTHNPEQAFHLSTSVLILDDGHSEYYPDKEELKDGKRLSMLYGRDLYLSEIDTGSNRRIICVPK